MHERARQIAALLLETQAEHAYYHGTASGVISQIKQNGISAGSGFSSVYDLAVDFARLAISKVEYPEASSFGSGKRHPTQQWPVVVSVRVPDDFFRAHFRVDHLYSASDPEEIVYFDVAVPAAYIVGVQQVSPA